MEDLHKDVTDLVDLLTGIFSYGLGRPVGQLTIVAESLVDRLREGYGMSEDSVEFWVEEKSEVSDGETNYVTSAEFSLRVTDPSGEVIKNVGVRKGLVEESDLPALAEENAEEVAARLPVYGNLPLSSDFFDVN